MARWIDTWMPGSGSSSTGTPGAPDVDTYPGERLGLPAAGAGATAGLVRRAAALTVDWFVGYLITLLLRGSESLGRPDWSFTVLGVWFLLTAVPVAVFGASAGMVALGIRVASIGDAVVVGVPRALLRTALIALVIPALVRDRDGRGWHDRATRTVVVRTRA